MKQATKLSLSERLEMSILLEREYSKREIAKALGRSPNTISAEIRRNSTNGVYEPKKAQAKARVKLRYRRFQWRKLDHDTLLKKRVIEGLLDHWNPDEIAGRMKEEHLSSSISKTAIYHWLYSARGQLYCSLLYSERYYPKKHKPKTKRVMISDRVSIGERCLEATQRSAYGHWEEDTVVSCKGGVGAIAVFNERKSRLVLGRKISSLSCYAHARVVKNTLKAVVAHSLTLDNGIENKKHTLYGVPTFFCDPYSSWQKGGVENANKMIRRYFPKGTNWSMVSQRRLNQAIHLINRKPRKILGYRTALEVAREAGIITNESVLFQGGI